MVHNGEINTIWGNADKMPAREETMDSGCLGESLHQVLPVIDINGSDSVMMGPWGGPASIVFSDGDPMGAVLDRNGLRPFLYYVMENGDVILPFEVGVLDVPEEESILKERLHPGKMLLADTVQGKIFQINPECEFFLFHTDENGMRLHFCMKMPVIWILHL